ncbi:hypothetical protein [Bacillus paranthracis]|uniref:hypothetical protein n=1 Tax=Bacillus paranthracis TaxID=2026186 RepID=UPI002D77361A|nr:hypothetical protein [Bacillus paranthracis]
MEEKKQKRVIAPHQLVQRSEIKRIAENLTKRELCNLINIHYHFYWNCVCVKNQPSAKMEEALRTYLEMPTATVYESIFALRSKSEKTGHVKRDENGNETYHDNLNVTKSLAEAVIQEMKDNDVYKEPKMYNEE